MIKTTTVKLTVLFIVWQAFQFLFWDSSLKIDEDTAI